MEGIVKCASCGCADSEIGEGTVFCVGCNAALGIVNKKIIEWDTTMVKFDGVLRQVFGGKEVPQEVAEAFEGTSLNHEISLNAMQLQAKINELVHMLNNTTHLAGMRQERIKFLEAENYRLRHQAIDDNILIQNLKTRLEAK